MPHPDAIPVSASIASVGKGIRYVGNYAYALSGKYPAEDTLPHIVLEFTTGSGVIVAELQFNGFVDDDAPDSRTAGNCIIYFNDITVALITTGDSSRDSPHSQTTKLIIPPLTLVRVEVDSAGTEADQYATITIFGRVYGAA